MKHGRNERHGRPISFDEKLVQLTNAGVPREDAIEIAQRTAPHGRGPAELPRPWQRPDWRRSPPAKPAHAEPRTLVLNLGGAKAAVTVSR